jgi:phosphatidylserine decarboxylase
MSNNFFNKLNFPNFAKEGYIFIAIGIVFTIFITFFSNTLGLLSLFLTAWCCYFFRDPIRCIPNIEGSIVSPADGKVITIDYKTPPEELGINPAEEMLRICIFMDVCNVHVNRIPISGTINKIAYSPGRFFNASLDKASIHNERMSYKLETENGDTVIFTQIAGLIARRIVTYKEEGSKVETGERFGMIKFGSRVDVYLPKHYKPLVFTGQITIAGETILSNMFYDGKDLEHNKI